MNIVNFNDGFEPVDLMMGGDPALPAIPESVFQSPVFQWQDLANSKLISDLSLYRETINSIGTIDAILPFPEIRLHINANEEDKCGSAGYGFKVLASHRQQRRNGSVPAGAQLASPACAVGHPAEFLNTLKEGRKYEVTNIEAGQMRLRGVQGRHRLMSMNSNLREVDTSPRENARDDTADSVTTLTHYGESERRGSLLRCKRRDSRRDGQNFRQSRMTVPATNTQRSKIMGAGLHFRGGKQMAAWVCGAAILSLAGCVPVTAQINLNKPVAEIPAGYR